MVDMNWQWDVDLMSYMDIEKLVKSLGYRGFELFWYRNSFALAHGLKPLQSDSDVIQLAEDVKSCEVIEIYMDHIIDIPIIVYNEDVKCKVVKIWKLKES